MRAKQIPLLMAWLAAFVLSSAASHADTPADATLERDIVRLCDQADYDKAAAAADKLVETRAAQYGAEDPRTAGALAAVGRVRLARWDLPGAGEVLRRAVNILENAPGHELALATALSDLADLYKERREFARAQSTYRRSIAIFKAAGKPRRSELSTVETKLADLILRAGRFSPHASDQRMTREIGDQSALHLAGTALVIHGLAHDDRAILSDLHIRCQFHLNFEQGQACIQRAQALADVLLGPNHPEHGRLLHLSARLAMVGQKSKEAFSFFERAKDKLVAALGPDHPEIAELYNDWAIAHLQHGAEHYPQAMDLREAAEAIEERYLDKLLERGTEAEKVAYVRFFESGVDVTMEICDRVSPIRAFRVAPALELRGIRLALSTILRRKGRVLELMTDNIAFLRANPSAEAQALLKDLLQARRAVSRQVVAGPRDGAVERFEVELMRLQDEADAVELRVSAWVAQHRKARKEPVTLERVQAAIPRDAALYEYYKYSTINTLQHFSAKDNPPSFDAGKYIAFFLRSKGDPVWILSVADVPGPDVEKIAAAYRKYAMDPNAEPPEGNERYRTLFDDYGDVSDHIQGVRHLLISPDGALNTVPFAILPTPHEPKHVLLEQYTITYLATGRDLLRPFSNAPNPAPAFVMANPDYDALGPQGVPQEPIDRQLLPVISKLYFPPLEGTAEEAKAITQEMHNPIVRTEGGATEAAMATMHGPSILHIATHGFFIDEKGRVGSGKNRSFVLDRQNPHAKSPAAEAGKTTPNNPVEAEEALSLLSRVNPLHLSGLALAGADVRHGQTDDGILTAYEAGTLDLIGTKLVVLSACETGIGEVAAGEGVLGLRRAFFMAGAQTQVMSLWQVDDAATSALMGTYYRFVLRHGLGRSEALRQAQLAIRANPKMAHPYYWGAFISSGAWGPVNGPAFGPIPVGTLPRAVSPGGSHGCGCKVAGDSNQSPSGILFGCLVYALSCMRRRGSANDPCDRDKWKAHRDGVQRLGDRAA